MRSVMRILPIGVVAALSASGCLSMQSQTTIDGNETATNVPYVEAFVEYAGPQEKWAGPASFTLHVIAKDAGGATVTVQPALFTELPPAGMAAQGRTPASQGLPGELAREHLAHLATSLQGADQAFRGCLSPVRVRLIRADGSLLEKRGCRSQSGWNRVASEAVSNFITATLRGAPAQREPAAGTPAAAATVPAGEAKKY